METNVARSRALVLVLTFIAYTGFHASRKPPSIVKEVLHPESQNGMPVYDAVTRPGWRPFADDLIPSVVSQKGFRVAGGKPLTINGAYQCHYQLTNASVCWKYVNKNGFALQRVVEPNLLEELQYKDLKSAWIIRYENVTADVCNNQVKVLHDWCVQYAQGADYSMPLQVPKNTSSGNPLSWKAILQSQGTSTVKVTPRVTDGRILLGYCDTIYLLAYAIGMFFTGPIADNVNIRKFLWVAMVGSGIFTILIGVAYYLQINSISYFYAVYLIQGLFQSMGWPAVAAIAGPWIEKGSRGFVMGIWGSSTFAGNIVGSLVASEALSWDGKGTDWSMAFITLGVILVAISFPIVCLLPKNLSKDPLALENDPEDGDELSIPEPEEDVTEKSAASYFLPALMIPGVIEYSLSLFFCKLVCYAFVYWLPLYLAKEGFSAKTAGFYSSFADIGGILGCITIGWLSDKYRLPASLCALSLVLCVPALYLYQLGTHVIGNGGLYHCLAMIVIGALPNGPYGLISTAIAVDLGTETKDNRKFLATVIAIVDATGSIGAAVQGLLIGYVASTLGWRAVFQVLIVCCLISALLLCRLVRREWRRTISYTSMTMTEGQAQRLRE